MTSNSKLRVLFCFCLVFALHLVMLFMLRAKNTLMEEAVLAPAYLQYVAIVSDPPIQAIPEFVAAPKANQTVRTNRSDLPTGASSTDSISIPSSEQPQLDLDNLRAGAVQQELKRQRSPIEQQQETHRRNHSLEARIERGTQQAARTDCRQAYAQTGLFAPLFIASDLLRDKGCQF